MRRERAVTYVTWISRGPLLVLVGILATACTGPSTVASPTATSAVRATDVATPTVSTPTLSTVTVGDAGCDSDVSDRLPAAVLRITAANDTPGEAAVGIYRIPEGHDFAELVAVVEEERRRAEVGEPRGAHPSYLTEGDYRLLDGGESAELALQLNVGTYAIFCLRTEAGALRPFQVLGPIAVD